MKFGTKMEEQKEKDWKFYYLEYNTLKTLLKKAEDGQLFEYKDEKEFARLLDVEVEKVHAFTVLKSEELERRVKYVEDKAESLLKNLKENQEVNFVEELEEDAASITRQISELARFIRLNYSAILKILKKHDKHTTYHLKDSYFLDLQSPSKCFHKLSFDGLIIRLSKIYDIIRTGGRREETGPPSGSSQTFVRRTTKYWVHKDNITEVKIHILKNLPVLIFINKEMGKADPAITSIYLDNDAMELYLGRLEKTQGAEAHRIRWYGDMQQTEIFFERKTHQEDWTGESSVKERFAIKEKHVNDFMAGRYTMDRTFEKMREKGLKKPEELDAALKLSREIQNSIMTRNLQPMIRTFYNRTAFQLNGDARVRISLDTELTMIREDNYGRQRSGKNWRRLDVGTLAPFDNLADEDFHAFPYAVLEVKLQTQMGTTPPEWVQDLISSHLVEEVPKFSKFIHGCATLLDKKVSLLPFWIPQMNTDIRKPVPEGGSLLERKKSSLSLTESAKGKKGKEPMKITQAQHADDIHVSVDEEEEDVTEDTPLMGTSKASTASKLAKKASMAWSDIIGFVGMDEKAKHAPPPPGSTEPLTSIPASHGGKRIALPVRIEPKVFFANERTFLSWLHFCIVLGGLALGLLNFGDQVGQISGLLFTVVAMMFMLYALYLYHWRAERIRRRDPGPYDDRIGPTVLVISLFCAVMVNFFLKFTSNK